MILHRDIIEYTFDDVLVLPGHSDIPFGQERRIDLSTSIAKHIRLDIPIISSPMPGVTEDDMAIAIAREGGMGFIHHFQHPQLQADQVARVKKEKLLCGASLGEWNQAGIDRCALLLKAGADVISIESAHADDAETLAFVRKLKKKFRSIVLSVAHVVTAEATRSVIQAGADSVRVGIGGGSHCSTRLVTGIGRPQLSAVSDCAPVCKKYHVPLISDGGIKQPGDVIKALACGAQVVMVGGILSGTDESPGPVIEKDGRSFKMTWGNCTATAIRQRHVLLKKWYDVKSWKGMIKQGVKSVIFGETEPDVVRHDLFEEGVESMVPYKGPVHGIIQQHIDGTRRGMWYAGAKNIDDLQKHARLILISDTTMEENRTRI